MPKIAGSMQSLLNGSIKPFVSFWINDFIIPINEAITRTLVPILTDTLVWAVDLMSKSFDNAVNHVNRLVNDVLLPAWVGFTDTFISLIPQIGTSLQNLLDGTLKPLVDYVINGFVIPIVASITDLLVPVFAQTMTTALDEFAMSFKWAVDLINDMYQTVLQPVFELIQKIVLDTLRIVKDAWSDHGVVLLNNIRDFMENVRQLFQQLWDKVFKAYHRAIFRDA